MTSSNLFAKSLNVGDEVEFIISSDEADWSGVKIGKLASHSEGFFKLMFSPKHRLEVKEIFGDFFTTTTYTNLYAPISAARIVEKGFSAGDLVSVQVPNPIPDAWKSHDNHLAENRERLATGTFKLSYSLTDEDGVNWSIDCYPRLWCLVHESWLRRASTISPAWTQFKRGDYVSIHVPDPIPERWANFKELLTANRERLAASSFRLRTSNTDISDGINWSLEISDNKYGVFGCLVHESWLKHAEKPAGATEMPDFSTPFSPEPNILFVNSPEQSHGETLNSYCTVGPPEEIHGEEMHGQEPIHDRYECSVCDGILALEEMNHSIPALEEMDREEAEEEWRTSLREKQRIADVVVKTGNLLDAYIAKRKNPTPIFKIRWGRIIGLILTLASCGTLLIASLKLI